MVKRFIVKRFIVLLGWLVMAPVAWAGRDELPLPLAQELQVEVLLGPKELSLYEDPQAGGAALYQFGAVGGLAAGVIGGAKRSSAERRLVQVRDQLADYNFNGHFEHVLREKIASAGISPNPRLRIRQDPASGSDESLPAVEDVLVLNPSYDMLTSFGKLRVMLTGSFVRRERGPEGTFKIREHVRRSYSFEFPLAGVRGNGLDDDARRWVAMGKPTLHALMQQGIGQVVDMLVYDYTEIGRIEERLSSRNMYTTIDGRTFLGRSVRRGQGWVWVRTLGHGGRDLKGYQPIEGVPGEAGLPVVPVLDDGAPVVPNGSQAVPVTIDSSDR